MKHLFIIAVAGLSGVIVACGGDAPRASTNAATATAATTPVVTATAAPATTVSSNACQANPDPANPTQVLVSQPVANSAVTSPLRVSGQINAFEATFRIAIKNASGGDIVAQTGHSQQGQVLAGFDESVPFTVSVATPACLWVYQASAKDGRPSMVLQVPITLTP